MTKDNGGPAFPQNDAGVNRINNHDGMTLRDYFAAAALQGILANNASDVANPCMSPDDYAREAFLYADAMLKARGE